MVGHGARVTMRVAAIAGACACLLTIPRLGVADSSGSHQVTVQVVPISEIRLDGGDISLSISSAEAGSEPASALDATSCDLVWATNEDGRKITVATSLASPTVRLEVEARNVSGGSSAGSVELRGGSHDLISSLTKGSGRCDLSYVATTTSGQTAAAETHAVTYTITDQ